MWNLINSRDTKREAWRAWYPRFLAVLDARRLPRPGNYRAPLALWRYNYPADEAAEVYMRRQIAKWTLGELRDRQRLMDNRARSMEDVEQW